MTTIEHLPLDNVHPHPENVRYHVGDVAELADSIAEKGLLQPITVAPDLSTPGLWVIILGHRRRAAHEVAGLDHIECIIREDLDTEQAQLEAMLIENLQRSELSPVEEAAGYERLTLFDVSPADIARRTGRAESTVRRRLELMRLPEQTRTQVHRGQLTLTQAEQIVEFAEDDEIMADLAGTPANRIDVKIQTYAYRARSRERALQRAEAVEAAGGTVHTIESLESLPDGARRIAEWWWPSSADDHLAQHTDGHAVVVYEYSTGEFCIDPASHDDDTTTTTAEPAGRKLTAEEVAARNAQEQLLTDLEAARDIRHAWLRKTLGSTRGTTPQMQELMLRQVLTRLLDTRRAESIRMWADLLGLSVDVDQHGVTRELVAAVQPWTTPRLIQGVWALMLVEITMWLELTEPWQWDLNGARREFRQLVELGYEPADAEQRMLDGDTS